MDARSVHRISSCRQQVSAIDPGSSLLAPTPRTRHHATRGAIARIPREHHTRLGARRLFDVHLRLWRSRRTRTGRISGIAQFSFAVAWIGSTVLQIPNVHGSAGGPSLALLFSLPLSFSFSIPLSFPFPFSLTIAFAIPFPLSFPFSLSLSFSFPT